MRPEAAEQALAVSARRGGCKRLLPHREARRERLGLAQRTESSFELATSPLDHRTGLQHINEIGNEASTAQDGLA